VISSNTGIVTWKGLGGFLCFFGYTEKSIDCRYSVKISNWFGFKEIPDQGVINLTEEVVGSTDGYYYPWEC
jgi:hypothetical protein